MGYNPKYKGVLKGVNISTIDNKLINILLEKDVFFKNEKNLRGNINSSGFDWLITFENESFEVKREVLEEIYYELDSYVTMKVGLHYVMSEIEARINKSLDKKSKVKIINKINKELLVEYNIDDGYFLYNIHLEDEQWYDWKEYIIELHGVIPKLIEFHLANDYEYLIEEEVFMEQLSSEYPIFALDIFRWNNYLGYKILSSFLQKKLNEVKSKNNHRKTNNTHISNSLTKLETAYFAYYMKEAKQKFVTSNFPSEEAFKELQKDYGPNWKNIQKDYLEISQNRDLRLLQSRRKKVEKIIPLLTPAALSIAEMELINM